MTEETLDDAALVRSAQKKGREGRVAFEQLIDRHQTWLVKLLTHLLGGQTDAEDVAQDALIRAYLAIHECRRGEGFKTWLRVIARRLAFNHRRDRRTRRRYQDDYADDAALRIANACVGRSDNRAALTAVLAELSYPFREILVLRYVEELSTNEIADVLEIGTSAAKMRLMRARTDFKTQYERMEDKRGQRRRPGK